MKDNQDDIELIERYLNDELSEDQVRDFETRKNEDKEFNSLFEELSAIIPLIEDVSRKDVKDILTGFDEKNFGLEENTTRERSFLSPVLKIAAALALLIVSFFAFRYYTKPDQHQVLFAENFSPLPNQILPNTRGIEIPKEVKNQAYYQYELGQYESAIELFNQIPETDDDGAVLLYSGISHLALEDYGNAKTLLQKYLVGQRPFHDEAQWYLFLSHVLSGDIATANETEKDMTSENYRKQEAKGILLELEGM